MLELEGLNRHVAMAGVSLAIVFLFVGAHNFTTPNEPFEVGYTEIETQCFGIDAGVCLGLERQQYTTYNYDNYTVPAEGTENYYRRIESELMLRAYNTCNESMSGMEWTSQVEYRNKTAAEWNQNDNIELLPCEQTFYREMK